MTDTDGILDRCAECGALAEFRGVPSRAYVQCSECANSTNPLGIVNAMVEWNKAQRDVKAKEGGGK